MIGLPLLMVTPWKQYEREKGNSNSISTLILVAFAILVIAWINYNMTTARSMERAREVGIRKVDFQTFSKVKKSIPS